MLRTTKCSCYIGDETSNCRYRCGSYLLFYRNSHCTNNNMKATGDVEVMVDVTDTVQWLWPHWICGILSNIWQSANWRTGVTVQPMCNKTRNCCNYAERPLLSQCNNIFESISKVYITWKQPPFRKDMHFIGKYPQEVWHLQWDNELKTSGKWGEIIVTRSCHKGVQPEH